MENAITIFIPIFPVISPSWSRTEEAKEAGLSVSAEGSDQSAGTAAEPLWSAERSRREHAYMLQYCVFCKRSALFRHYNPFT